MAAAALALALASCDREARSFKEAPQMAATPQAARMSELQAGGTTPERPRPIEQVSRATTQHAGSSPYEENAYAVAQGKRLFVWFNCVGCHAHGGGGIGPPLMDDTWIYGHEAQNIFQTIVQGRPNGMPSFRDRITEQQAWQLVAYVRSMSGLIRADVLPGRSDTLSTGEAEVSRDRQAPKPSTPPQTQ
jgi:cytochrome c oxidase cbb3-type subunit 3